VIDGTPSGYIGEEGELPVVIPDALFKIVIKEGGDPDQPEVLAFLYPQVGPGYSRDAPYPHHHYLVSVDEVETATGLDFLTTLPDVIESTIEKRRTEWLWPVDDGDFLYACR
jgi:endonuclease G